MLNRRALLRGTVGIGTAAISWPSASSAAKETYDKAVETTWGDLKANPRDRELVRFATLAANSHNSQPWAFFVSERKISIAPDFSRRCEAVDPDDHHLFVSLGCALENMLHAAAANGLKGTPKLADETIEVDFEPTQPKRTALFSAIQRRQCTRAVYDRRPVATDAMRLLEEAGHESGVSVMMIADRARFANLADYVMQGNSAQMRNDAFMRELIDWMRFSEADAVETKDGLFSRSSGNPAMPSWLARPLLRFFFTERGENAKYREHIESSAGIAIFVSDAADKAHWIAAGRACQRFALQATALGLKYAFINQPVEVPQVRSQFASYLGIGNLRPDLIVRFGAGPDLPKSLRRPPEQVIR
jgi:hypothetical protein